MHSLLPLPTESGKEATQRSEQGPGDNETIAHLASETTQFSFFHDLVENSPDGIIVINTAGGIEFANRTCEDLFGYPAHELSGQSIYILVPDGIRPDHAGFREALVSDMHTRSMGRLSDLEARTKAGENIPVDVALSPLALGTDTLVVATIRDAARQRDLIQKLDAMASTDPLTGALNRRSFHKIAERELERNARYGMPVSLMMLDIDHFKRVNDDYGHDAGDRALVELTRTCLQFLRKNDSFARLGGEEFAIIAPEAGIETARVLAERLRHALGELAISSGQGPFSFTVSIGVTEVQRVRQTSKHP